MELIITKIISVCFDGTGKINVRSAYSDDTDYNKNQKRLFSDGIDYNKN